MKEPEDSAPFKMISMRKIFRITLFIAAIAAAAWGCVGVYEDSSELALGWKSNVESISPQELNSIITAGEDVLVIDVRE